MWCAARRAAANCLSPCRRRLKSSCSLPQTGTKKAGYSAFQTLQSWPPDELQQVLSDPATPAAVLDFVANNLAPGRKELRDALLRNPSLPGQLREWLENTAALFAEAESSESSEAARPRSRRQGQWTVKP